MDRYTQKVEKNAENRLSQRLLGFTGSMIWNYKNQNDMKTTSSVVTR